MKRAFFLSLSFCLLTIFSQNILSAQSLKAGLLNGPSAIPAAYLIEHKSEFKSAELDFQIFSGADLELPKLLKGEIDLAVLPPNAAAKVWNISKGNIVTLAIISEGNISLLTNDKNYRDLKSLERKTVYCAGRGATPEYIFRHILSEQKIENVNLDFSIPNPELAGSLVSGKTQYIVVPEPFSTVALTKGKEAGVKKAEDLSDYFTENFPITVLVCNKKSLENPETKNAVKEYLSIYEKAVKWTNENPKEAGVLVEKHTLGLNASIAAASIPNGHYVFIPAKYAREKIENLLSLFMKENPEAIGGKLPDETFYYNGK
ncbi:MAG: ABC transporter substrate-binding protein [Treponema sp.]|nr:ABC transporter substrate-binding protein [Treponema sp.]